MHFCIFNCAPIKGRAINFVVIIS